eukprot:3844535-Pyramimonas_sp.AAC.1
MPDANCTAGGNGVDVRGDVVDVRGYGVNVRGYGVDVRGYDVNVRGDGVDVRGLRRHAHEPGKARTRLGRDLSGDVRGYGVDVRGCYVDVGGCCVDVRGCYVDVRGLAGMLTSNRCVNGYCEDEDRCICFNNWYGSQCDIPAVSRCMGNCSQK